MNRHLFRTSLLMVLLAAFLVPRDASAVPVFARKYGFNCTMCHSGMPRLNDFGEQYRANGYRLPGRENEERTVLDSPPPVTFRTSAGYNGDTYNTAAQAPDNSAFQLNGLDLLSAGLLGRNVGYFLVYVPQLNASRGVVGQESSLEMASLVFSQLGSTWFNLRVGRFEPAFVPISAKRQLAVSPYDVYESSFPDGPALSATQTGLEVSGWGRQPFRYAAGVVTGSETNRSYDTGADVYGRATYVIGRGEGQTVGQRIGAMAVMGSARPGGGYGSRETYSRFGADASLNAFHANLALQYLWGIDDPTLWARPAGEDNVTWSGGFAELSVLPAVRWIGFARYDRLTTPDILDRDSNRFTVGSRYYFEDNVVVHAEFSRYSRNPGNLIVFSPGGPVAAPQAEGDGDPVHSFVTLRVDLAF